MILRYTDRSENDVEFAFKWYEIQRRGLGFEFLDCVEMSLSSILRFPEMYKICYSTFRRCVIRRFPFSIFYTIEGEEIVIHSVFDNRQDPQKRP
jgi:plasmid stabilization system protein ParE